MQNWDAISKSDNIVITVIVNINHHTFRLMPILDEPIVAASMIVGGKAGFT